MAGSGLGSGTGSPVALVVGAHGLLGAEVVPALSGAGWRVVAPVSAALDVTDRRAVRSAIHGVEPDWVVNLAAWADVDGCEHDPEAALRVNGSAVRHLADGCAEVGARLCQLSTDYVFSGTKGTPYDEWDEPAPLSAYGRSKLVGEHEAGDEALIVRTAWLCSGHRRSIVRRILDLAASGAPMAFVDDQVGSPTAARPFAGKLVELMAQGRRGLHHVTNSGEASWFDVARHVAKAAGFSADVVRPVHSTDPMPPRPAPRPAFSVLDNAVLRTEAVEALPAWQEDLSRLARRLAEPSSGG